MKILARTNETKLLLEILNSSRSEFLAVYGRRRVGKTYLIRNFFLERGLFFHITGVSGQRSREQLWNFARVFADVFNGGEPIAPPDSWQQAFDLLRLTLQQLDTKGRIILFLDELPWLATKKSGFIPALSYVWNRYLETDPRVVLVVCGSAASWMVNNVINSRGGLYNRLTRKLPLSPLDLHDAEAYLRGKGVRLSRKQIVEVYMAVGGIPAYLDAVRPGRSSAQIIADLCFDPTSPLSDEFDQLHRSMFTNSELHSRAMRVLLKPRVGRTTSEWFAAANIPSGSVQRRVKQELVEAGFVAVAPMYGTRKRGALVRLIDEYTVFQLTWHKTLQDTRHRPSPETWRSLQSSPQWAAWSGYAFEGIWHRHVGQLAKALGFHGIRYSTHTWRHLPQKEDEDGAQIDLVIDRADGCINLCEVKFHNSEFIVTKAYARRLEQKRDLFLQKTRTRKTVFVTLVTSLGANENQHYREVVDNHVTIDALFEKID